MQTNTTPTPQKKPTKLLYILVPIILAVIATIVVISVIVAGQLLSTRGASSTRTTDQAYLELKEIHGGLAKKLGVTWGEPTAIGPAPCSSGGSTLHEVWLDYSATSSRPIVQTLDIAANYLNGIEGLALDAEGFKEYRSGELFADRVTARRGDGFIIEVRASTNNIVNVTGVSECIPGDWTDGWQAPL